MKLLAEFLQEKFGVENHKSYKTKIRFINEIFLTKNFCNVEFTDWIDELRTKKRWLSSLKRTRKLVNI